VIDVLHLGSVIYRWWCVCFDKSVLTPFLGDLLCMLIFEQLNVIPLLNKSVLTPSSSLLIVRELVLPGNKKEISTGELINI